MLAPMRKACPKHMSRMTAKNGPTIQKAPSLETCAIGTRTNNPDHRPKSQRAAIDQAGAPAEHQFAWFHKLSEFGP